MAGKEDIKSDSIKDRGPIPNVVKEALEAAPIAQLLEQSGFANGALYESYPALIQATGQKIITGPNNSVIRMGRDQPGSRTSGYGGRGESSCGMLDIICGLAGHRGTGVVATNGKDEKTYANPNFSLDAARLYMSQKTDIDANMGLAKGSVGNDVGKSAVGMKADGLRFVARQGIKFVTGIDAKNSQGDDNTIIKGIDLIAWNDDKELQPMVKGGNLETCLLAIVKRLDELNGTVDTLLMTQMKLNAAILTHTHLSPFFGAPTTPSPMLGQPGIKCMIDQLLDTKMGLIKSKFNLQQVAAQHLGPAAKRHINSRWNNVN